MQCSLGGVETSLLTRAEGLATLGVESRILLGPLTNAGAESMAANPRITADSDETTAIDALRTGGFAAAVAVDEPRFVELAAALGVPVVFESHNSFMPQVAEVHRQLDHAAVRLFVVPSEFNRRLLERLSPHPVEIAVVPNPIDTEVFRPLSTAELAEHIPELGEGAPLLWVGRLQPQKNPREFAEIASTVMRTRPDVHAVIVGAPVEPDYAESLAWSVPEQLRDRFTFVHSVDHSSMPALYSAAAAGGGCLIQTSLNESSSMIVLEAMACGCPVVATNVGGTAELVDDGAAGFLYRQGDIDAAIGLVERVLGDERQGLAQAALARIRERHAAPLVARAYLDALGAFLGAG